VQPTRGLSEVTARNTEIKAHCVDITSVVYSSGNLKERKYEPSFLVSPYWLPMIQEFFLNAQGSVT
jgi:hypothetical protein